MQSTLTFDSLPVWCLLSAGQVWTSKPWFNAALALYEPSTIIKLQVAINHPTNAGPLKFMGFLLNWPFRLGFGVSLILKHTHVLFHPNGQAKGNPCLLGCRFGTTLFFVPYCWWKKSCTKSGIFSESTGACRISSINSNYSLPINL